jgi:hypothetical protein
MGSPTQGNIELMSKKEILNFKPTSRLEQIGAKRPKQMEDGKHRVGRCADSTLSRESRMDGIFGNDRMCVAWIPSEIGTIASRVGLRSEWFPPKRDMRAAAKKANTGFFRQTRPG